VVATVFEVQTVAPVPQAEHKLDVVKKYPLKHALATPFGQALALAVHPLHPQVDVK